MPECIIWNVKIHVEVPLLLIFFAFQFSDSIRTNLIIFRTCYVTLGYNKSECTLLGSKTTDNKTVDLEKAVEPYAAVVHMVHSLTEGLLPAVICLFIGPWSDRFGRKPFLIIPVIGYILYFAFLVVFSLLENTSPWFCILCLVPVFLTGGESSYITIALCYDSDVTNETHRGVRLGIFEAIHALAIFLGNISSSYVFIATNYPTIFAISTTCCLLNFLFTVIFIPESVTNRETEGRLNGLFDLTNIKDMFIATFKSRRNYDRLIILCCLFMLIVYIIVSNGDGAVAFLFVREKFHWSLQQYTILSAATNIVWALGALIGTYFLHKLMKISETFMILLGFLSMFFGMLVMGLALYDWQIYAASFSRALGGVLNPMVGSLVSKIVPKEEFGKIFALFIVSQTLFGIAGSPMFTAIYNATILTNPAIFNFVGVGVYGFEILIAITIIYICSAKRSEVTYQEIVDEDDNCD